MKTLHVQIPEDFKRQLQIAANQERVSQAVYLMKVLQEKWDWPLESIPVGNIYRPMSFVNPFDKPDINEEF